MMNCNSATGNDEDASTRRVFLEVQIAGEEAHRFLQLEPHVNFKKVLKAIRRIGDLVWNGVVLRPMETPKSVGMPRGLANVVFLRLFTRGPVTSSRKEGTRDNTPQAPPFFVLPAPAGKTRWKATLPPEVSHTHVFAAGHATADAAGSHEEPAQERSREGIGALEIGLRELRFELEAERGKREALEREFCRLQWERRRPRHGSTAEEIHRWQMEELRRQRGVTWRTRRPSAATSN
ncbi:hypothetical protein MOQ_002911 [Trypanosoma cruzi marinkellei]|uniref:Uncharacterized protein n=1 Tax=Trypanosoma cruzi marinkellei TaxID=85056 RepID=K2NWD3_TRYCR|nr:hypothetical protein MOQ_002911 [Trypanosoma cruzi marinkellei]